jgi:adenylosuccinate synthase
MSNVIILGAQWGDEGKGKVVDLFSGRFDIVARYQGGNNAGHTVHIGSRTFVLKLIPSGILRPGKQSVIGNGVVIQPAALLEEIETLEAAGLEVDGRLFISSRAHVVLPTHRALEKLNEARPGRAALGTTSRGIGPCYEDKIGRRGLRVADLLDREIFEPLLETLICEHQAVARAFGIPAAVDAGEVRAQYLSAAERLRPMVCDTARLLNAAIVQGRSVMFEGAQGTLLDIDHGTYPFVTSSSAAAGGACTGTGVPPTCIDAIVGVAKAYVTRVGGGPFPTEALDAAGDRIRTRGHEFGSVTGRPRRCGWFDVPLLRYAAMINGFDSMVITKLDVLDEMDSIPVCVGYGSAGMTEIPATTKDAAALQPVYERLPGWRTSTFGISSYQDLPVQARDYLAFLEQQTGVEVGCISTGPERNQTIVKPGSRFAELFA